MGRAFEYRKAAKEKRWGNMSRVFPKLAKAITLAAKAGVPDPSSNAALRNAILNAKAQNLPKDNIAAAIKRASDKDVSQLAEVNYEGKGPHGVLVFVECATDNNTRTVANIKNIFNKNGGKMVPTGSLEFMFDRKVVIEFSKGELDLEELELDLIDFGLESIQEDGDTCYVYGDFQDYGTLTSGFEKLDIKIIKVDLQRIPNSPQEISDEQMEELTKILDKLEDDDDVQAVYTNLQ